MRLGEGRGPYFDLLSSLGDRCRRSDRDGKYRRSFALHWRSAPSFDVGIGFDGNGDEDVKSLGSTLRKSFPMEAYGGPTFYIERALAKESGRRGSKLIKFVFGVGLFSTMLITMSNYTFQESFKATFNI